MTYLHLSFLGFTSCFIIGLLIAIKILSTSSMISKIGLAFILFGVVFMELTIGLKSFPLLLNVKILKSLNVLLLVESFILLLGIAMLLFYSFIFPKRDKNKV